MSRISPSCLQPARVARRHLQSLFVTTIAATLRRALFAFMKQTLLLLSLLVSAIISACAACAAEPAPKFELPGGSQGEWREGMIKKLYAKPYPPQGAWHYVGRALSAYWTGDRATGDKAVAGLKEHVLTEKSRKDKAKFEDGFHWQAYQLARIVFLFGREGVFKPGSMGADAEKTARELMWTWFSTRADKALVAPAHDWWYWGSENHHLQMWASLWGSACVLAGDPDYRERPLAGGWRAADYKKGFDEYFKRWFRNRGTRGLFVECNSPTYAKYSVGVMFNFVDFSDDPGLRRLARSFLDLYWARWALEQQDGKRAGSRHRSYAGSPSILGESITNTAECFFEIARPPDIKKQSVHPGMWCAATTTYTPPALVREVAARRDELGDYQIVSRQPGRRDPAFPDAVRFVDDPRHPMTGGTHGANAVDPQCRSMLRKTFATPAFILGTTMVPALPREAWTAISGQNRWDGVVFSGKDAQGRDGLRIFTQPQRPKNGSLYNTHWSVMERGVVIFQRLKESNAKGARMFFSAGLKREEHAKSGWIFVEAPAAYAAVKVCDGRWKWEADSRAYWREENDFKPGLGEWLAPEKEFSPVILEVVAKTACPDFDVFKKRILENKLRVTRDRVEYASTLQARETPVALTLFHDFSKSPLIGGKPVNYEPPEVFAGPVLQGDFGGKSVTLRAFGKTCAFGF